ncbi:hypothetical protein A2716_01365 [candidate division WWE3 bacterium RIFCSPHIGHO2_01_FULL_40_23]|nr:MAG: hypothetical protein A2716_01365 [candidate division WWE3 bacterium RIFCSPHIGHO2_01_FULL_40_23]
MQDDCDDIRFTDINGKILRFQMTGSCSSATNTFEVVFPTIVNGTNVGYAYYSNPAAVSASVDVSDVTALTPSGGDPSDSNPTANDEVGPGPIAYWKFDEGAENTCSGGSNDACDSARGTGGNLDLAFDNSAGTTPDYVTEDRCISGKCVILYDDNDNPYLYTANGFPFPTTDFTYSFWFRHTDTATGAVDAGWLVLYTNSDGSTEFEIRIGSNQNIVVNTNGGASEITSVVTLDNGRWYHVVATRTGSSLSLYLNGILDTQVSNASAMTYSGCSLIIGTDDQGADCAVPLLDADITNNFTGSIDELKVYDRGLTAAQVKSEYLIGTTAKGSSVSISAPQVKYLSDELDAYWPMDESGSTSPVDYSGFQNTLTRIASPTMVSAKFGNGADLESGSSQYFTRSDRIEYSITGSLTLAAWIKPESVTASTLFDIVGKFDDANESYQLSQYGDEIRMYIDSSSNYATTDAANLATGTWYHVAGVYDATSQSVAIYINGSLASSTVTGTIPSGIGNDAGVFHIGAEDSTTGGDAPGNFYDGIIDEVRMYSRALPAKDVSSLYTFAPGPVGWWKLDENSGTTAFDSSNKGNNLTLTNGPAWVPGKQGSALEYDGNTQCAINSATSGIAPITDMTVAAWVYARAPAADDDAIINLSGTDETEAENVNFYFFINDTNNVLRLTWEHGGGVNDIISSTVAPAIKSGQWVHFAATRNTSTNEVMFYENGIQLGTTVSYTNDPSGGTSDQRLDIGHESSTCLSGTNEGFNGKISDVIVYNYVRTGKQIIEDLNAGHPTIGTVGSYVAHWDMDDATGTIAQDTSINNNDLTLSTASWTLQGKFNSAWNGNGTSRLAPALGNNPDFDFSATEDFTLSIWFKSDLAGNPTATEYLAANGGPSGSAGYALYATDTNGFICFGIDDDASWGPDVSACTTSDYYDNTWHHIVGVRNVTADTIYIYIDGVLKGQTADTTSATLDSNGTFRLGDIDTDDAASGEELAGDLDEVKVYRLALSASDVKLEYNRASSLVLGSLSTESDGLTTTSSAASAFCIPGDTTSCNPPVGYWKLDDNTGTTAVDSSGNGNNGSFVGSPSWGSGCKSGSCITTQMNGVEDNVNIPNPANDVFDFPPGTDFTAQVWVKIINKEDYVQPLFRGGSSVGTNGYEVEVHTTTKLSQCGYADGTTRDVATGTTALVDGRWHFISCVMDRNGTATGTVGLHVFVDGVLEGSDTSLGAVNNFDNTRAIEIGERSNSTEFDGSTDMAAIYNYARTRAQVAWDFNRGVPIAYWDFDECQGATIHDASTKSDLRSTGINGTITLGGSPSLGDCTTAATAWGNGATGKYNSSLDFDGSDDYILFGDVLDQTTNDFTFSAWIKRGDDTTNHEIVSKGGAAEPSYSFGIDGATDVLRLIVRDSGGQTTADSTRTVNDTNWHHVVVVADRDANATFYIDGTPAGTVDISTRTGTLANGDNFEIGRSRDQTTVANGLIDDLRIFNYALTATQIKILYNQSSSVRFGPETGTP